MSSYDYVNFWEINPGQLINLPAGPKKSIEFLVLKVETASSGMYTQYKMSGVDSHGNLKEVIFMKGAGHIDETRKIRLIPREDTNVYTD